MSKFLFIASGPLEFASSRLRAYWIAEQMESAQVIQAADIGQIPPDAAEVFVWQKSANAETIRQQKDSGAQVFWDVCDPSWWWQPEDSRMIANAVDGVVCSNFGLYQDFNIWYGSKKAVVIPDRLNFEHYPKRRTHSDTNEPIRLIWFGIMQNRIALGGTMAFIERLHYNGVNVELTVADERPDMQWMESHEIPTYFTKWTLAKENTIIAAHDIAILPRYPGPWGVVKSNNKNLVAAACGLPDADCMNWDRLYKLATDADYRQKQTDESYQFALDNYSIEDSAHEWEELANGRR